LRRTVVRERAVREICEDDLPARRALEQARVIGAGLAAGEWGFHLQPIVHAQSGQVVRFEALLRAHQPDAPPIQAVVSACERVGTAAELGRAALAAACRQIRSWSQRGLAPAVIAVNLSPNHLLSPLFERDLIGILRHHDIRAGALELELVEDPPLAPLGRAIALLTRMRRQGIVCAIDDFGAGSASLRYLRELPVARVKLDRSYVTGLPHLASSREIVQALVALAHRLGVKVTGEGVETQEQAEFLRAVGCDELQGFLFGRPAPADSLARYLRRG